MYGYLYNVSNHFYYCTFYYEYEKTLIMHLIDAQILTILPFHSYAPDADAFYPNPISCIFYSF